MYIPIPETKGRKLFPTIAALVTCASHIIPFVLNLFVLPGNIIHKISDNSDVLMDVETFPITHPSTISTDFAIVMLHINDEPKRT